jgi:predicted NUDIX family NTP pyrophosphohydrolase
MPKQSAGILLYRFKNSKCEVLLVHPGGPFWVKKDLGVWSIPKGEFTEEELPLDAAKREFYEETGSQISGDFIALTPGKQKSGKVIYAFTAERDLDVTQVKSNTFQIEWPPKSGKQQEFPEIDKAKWFDFETSKLKLNESQALFIDELAQILRMSDDEIQD